MRPFPHPDPLPEGEGAASKPFGIIVGLAAEARIARPLGARVAIGGGTAAGAAQAAEFLAPNVCAIISFGLAGGLDPGLPPGTLLIPALILADGENWPADPTLIRLLGGPTVGPLFGDGAILATAAQKSALHTRTGAAGVDLESAAVARTAAHYGLPFAALRAVCDPATRDLPPAALIALDVQGRIGTLRIAASLLTHPGQIPALIALARDAAQARRALVTRVRAIGRLDPPA